MSLLPSQQSALAVVNGAPGAWVDVARDAGGRGLIILVGALAAGLRAKHAVRAAIGGTLAIEAFVLGYTYMTRGKQ